MTIWSMKAKDEVTTHLTKSVLSTVLFVAKNLQQYRAGMHKRTNCTQQLYAYNSGTLFFLHTYTAMNYTKL